MDLYSGENPASKIKLPKLNNEITECLSKDDISRLLKTCDIWINQREIQWQHVQPYEKADGADADDPGSGTTMVWAWRVVRLIGSHD